MLHQPWPRGQRPQRTVPSARAAPYRANGERSAPPSCWRRGCSSASSSSAGSASSPPPHPVQPQRLPRPGRQPLLPAGTAAPRNRHRDHRYHHQDRDDRRRRHVACPRPVPEVGERGQGLGQHRQQPAAGWPAVRSTSTSATPKLDPNATHLTASSRPAARTTSRSSAPSAKRARGTSPTSTACKDQGRGKATGIPDLRALRLPAARCDPDTYIIGGYGPYMRTTAKANPQTYYGQHRRRPLLHIASFKGLPRRLRSTTATSPTLKCRLPPPNFQGDADLGIKAGRPGSSYARCGCGSARAALTPVISGDKGSGLVVRLRRRVDSAEHHLAGARRPSCRAINSVKVWACNSGMLRLELLPAGRVGRNTARTRS